MRRPSSLGDFSENGAGVGFAWLPLLFVMVSVTSTSAETLTVRTGETEVQSARAVAAGSKSQADGKLGKGEVVFDKLLPGERYDLTLTTPDSRQLHLIDISWYAELPKPDAEPGPMTDEDRAAIQEILTEIKAFTNKNTILTLAGNADRAVALVELIRDTDFHARKGDEIIWRIEVWYFEFQAGGWAKVQQQNRIVERERFKSTEAFEKHRKPLVWFGIEKGLKIEKGQNAVVDLPKTAAR